MNGKRKTDVAAFVWPSYTGDEPRTRIFWPDGIGEWQTVKAANPEKVYLHLTEGAEHAFSIVVDEESYVSHIREFFEKII